MDLPYGLVPFDGSQTACSPKVGACRSLIPDKQFSFCSDVTECSLDLFLSSVPFDRLRMTSLFFESQFPSTAVILSLSNPISLHLSLFSYLFKAIFHKFTLQNNIKEHGYIQIANQRSEP